MSRKAGMTIEQAISYYEELAFKARRHGMCEESKRLGKKCQILRDKLTERKLKTVEGRRDFAQAFERLGDISLDQRQYKRAGKYYKKSFEIRSTLVKEVKSAEIRHELYVSCNKLANLANRENDSVKRTEYLRKMLEISRLQKTARGSIQDLIEYQYCCYILGKMYMSDQSTYEEGKRLIHTAIRISRQKPNAQLRKQAAEARDWLRMCDGEAPNDYERKGKKAREHGMLEEAQSYYRKGLESRLRNADRDAMYGELREIDEDYSILGDIAVELEERNGGPRSSRDY
jgi:tetratricopeptide (TPR) repeat protein